MVGGGREIPMVLGSQSKNGDPPPVSVVADRYIGRKRNLTVFLS